MERIAVSKIEERAGYLMFALSLLISAMSIVLLVYSINNLTMSAKEIICISVELTGIAVFNVYIAGCFLDHADSAKTKLNFMNFIFVLDMTFLSEICTWATDNNTEPLFIKLNYLSNSLYYVLNVLAILAFIHYLYRIIPKREKWMRKFSGAIQIYLDLLAIAMIFNAKYGFIFKVIDGVYVRSIGATIVFLLDGLILLGIIRIVWIQDMDRILKSAIIVYLGLPTVFTIVQMFVYGFSFISIAVVISVSILYVEGYLRQGTALQEERLELQRQQTSVMLSQIQPHFLYNSLSAIVALCDIDPKLAKQTTLDFSTYLERNLEAVTTEDLIPFDRELEHVKAYLRIEQTRFGNKLKTEYDIETTDFRLPPLTLQPLVENAVKHGICHKKDGGTVRISVEEKDKGWFVRVEDNGTGFDVEHKEVKGHGIGLESIKLRVENLAKGKFTIASEENLGTTATIFIPKDKNREKINYREMD